MIDVIFRCMVFACALYPTKARIECIADDDEDIVQIY